MPGNDSLTRRRIADEVDKIDDDVGLGGPDTWAFQKAEQSALDDDLTYALAAAAGRLGNAEGYIYDAKPETDVEVRGALRDVDERLTERVREVARDAVETTIDGHDVDLRHAMRETCPGCGEETEHYHLGSTSTDDADHAVGWVCGHCETESLELIDATGNSVALRVVDDDQEGSDVERGETA